MMDAPWDIVLAEIFVETIVQFDSWNEYKKVWFG
jgi:hypothetical protein